MKRSIVAACVSGALAVVGLVALPGTPVSRAATTTTINGPAHVPYYSTVTLTGTSPDPNETVTVYFHKKGTDGYVARRTVTSDANGNYTTTYGADTDYRYYAVAGGSTSAVGLTQIVTASCTTSGPAFRRLPYFPGPGQTFDRTNPDGPAAEFTATNNDSLWAGVAYGNSQIAVITWSSRTGRLTELGRYNYVGHVYKLGMRGSVNVVALTRAGSVVAQVQRTNSNLQDAKTIGVVYSAGKRYVLRAAPSWNYVRPVGISGGGTIVGEVMVGQPANHPHFYVVSWANATAAPHIVANTGSTRPYPAVDGNGDIGFENPTSSWIRLARGGLITAPGHPTQMFGGTSGSVLVGLSWPSDFGGKLTTWNTAGVGDGGTAARRVLLPGNLYPWVLNVGAGGSTVVLVNNRVYLYTSKGAWVRIPNVYPLGLGGGGDPAVAITSAATVAFTSSTDGLPHFLRCY